MMTTQNPPLRLAENPDLWPGLARVHVDAVVSARAPRRVLVSGPAGSGKSRLLRHLRRELAASGASVASARTGTPIGTVPVDQVLIVDDAHLLDPDQIDALLERVADPEAALVVAVRPWTQSSPVHPLAQELERSQPAIVLGGIGRIELRGYVEKLGWDASDACLDSARRDRGHRLAAVGVRRRASEGALHRRRRPRRTPRGAARHHRAPPAQRRARGARARRAALPQPRACDARGPWPDGRP